MPSHSTKGVYSTTMYHGAPRPILVCIFIADYHEHDQRPECISTHSPSPSPLANLPPIHECHGCWRWSPSPSLTLTHKLQKHHIPTCLAAFSCLAPYPCHAFTPFCPFCGNLDVGRTRGTVRGGRGPGTPPREPPRISGCRSRRQFLNQKNIHLGYVVALWLPFLVHWCM